MKIQRAIKLVEEVREVCIKEDMEEISDNIEALTTLINFAQQSLISNAELPEKKEEIVGESRPILENGKVVGAYNEIIKHRFAVGFNQMHDIASKVIAKKNLEIEEKDKRIIELEEKLKQK